MVSNITLLVLQCLLALAVLISSNGETTRELIETSSISTTATSALAHLHDKQILVDEKCDKSSIEIKQAPMTPLPGGIPAYSVKITNTCATDCIISDIHIACGWFNSAIPINPRLFKRLSYNDCLVYDGNPLPSGGIFYFWYANAHPYAFSVSSVVCH